MSAFTLLCGQSRGQPHPPLPSRRRGSSAGLGPMSAQVFSHGWAHRASGPHCEPGTILPKGQRTTEPVGGGRGGDTATGGTGVTPNHSPSHFTMLPPPGWVRRSAPGTELECRKCLFNAPTDQTTDLSSRADLGDISRSFLKQFYDNNLSFFLFLFS